MPSSAASQTDAHRTLSVRLSADEYQALSDLAWRERTSASRISRDALRAQLPAVAAASKSDQPAAA